MILDTSAILAILFKEADAPYFARKIAAAVPCRMSVANLLEAAIVIGGRGESAESDLDRFVDAAEIELMPVTTEQVARAREAWRRFGKGNHPAALNFGDCFAYALARTTGSRCCSRGRTSHALTWNLRWLQAMPTCCPRPRGHEVALEMRAHSALARDPIRTQAGQRGSGTRRRPPRGRRVRRGSGTGSGAAGGRRRRQR